MDSGIEQTTLRETLEANMASAEEGTLAEVKNAPEIVDNDPLANGKPRDENGRFASKEQDQQTVIDQNAQIEQQQIQRPTTWKREYLPIWDKIAKGDTLNPEEAKKLAAYSNQREKEFASGVAAYKAEATQARDLTNAMTPFVPDLQKHGINPIDWITNLGNAHKTLVQGTPQQKIEMFTTLAREYGVPLQAVTQGSQGQLDPIVPELMAYIGKLEDKVNTVTGHWDNQTRAAQAQLESHLQQEVSKLSDAEKYPHFEMVREDMAQLLEFGKAQNYDDAYKKAVRMNDEAWEAEQARQAQTLNTSKISNKQAAVSKAKAAAVSVKSGTPSGVTNTVDVNDRLAALRSGFDSLASSRV